MALTIYQKSIYLIIFNVAMILRSGGKNIRARMLTRGEKWTEKN